MSRNWRRRGGWALVAGLLTLASCTGGSGTAGEEAAGAPGETSGPVSPTPGQEAAEGGSGESSAAEPDYSKDAGTDLPEYVYTDIAPPADTTVGTLCNLSQEFLAGIRGPATSVPSPNLRTTLLGFEDLLQEWVVLEPHYPEHAEDFETAREVFEYWQEAVWHAENGESEEAGEAMAAAETALSKLPETAPEGCI